MKAGALTLVVATLLAGCTATPEPIATGVRPTSAPPPASSPASAGATATPTRATTAPTSTASTAARPVKVTLTVSADGPATVNYSDGWHTYATATRGGTTVVTFYTDADYVLAATVAGHAKTGERSCELDAGGRSHLASAGGAEPGRHHPGHGVARVVLTLAVRCQRGGPVESSPAGAASPGRGPLGGGLHGR